MLEAHTNRMTTVEQRLLVTLDLIPDTDLSNTESYIN